MTMMTDDSSNDSSNDSNNDSDTQPLVLARWEAFIKDTNPGRDPMPAGRSRSPNAVCYHLARHSTPTLSLCGTPISPEMRDPWEIGCRRCLNLVTLFGADPAGTQHSSDPTRRRGCQSMIQRGERTCDAPFLWRLTLARPTDESDPRTLYRFACGHHTLPMLRHFNERFGTLTLDGASHLTDTADPDDPDVFRPHDEQPLPPLPRKTRSDLGTPRL